MLIALGGASAADAAEPPFLAPPTGPYRVGTRDLHWIDGGREEPFTGDTDDRRHVMVQIWYPAEAAPGAERAPYLLRPEEFGDDPGLAAAREVRTNSLLEAPIVRAPVRLPLLLFHHGGGWTRFSSSFVTEEMAGHGYVVAAVGHGGFNRTLVYPDSYRPQRDLLPVPEETGDLHHDALASWRHLDEHHFPVWLADARFALDRLDALDEDPDWFLAGRLDLERVGAFGWSFGGALSIQSSRSDARIAAAVDLEQAEGVRRHPAPH